MGRQTELDIGRPPCSRRIFRLWTRRETVDCITQVGSSDPLRGATVIAINTPPRVQTLKIRRELVTAVLLGHVPRARRASKATICER